MTQFGFSSGLEDRALNNSGGWTNKLENARYSYLNPFEYCNSPILNRRWIQITTTAECGKFSHLYCTIPYFGLTLITFLGLFETMRAINVKALNQIHLNPNEVKKELIDFAKEFPMYKPQLEIFADQLCPVVRPNLLVTIDCVSSY